MITEAFSFIGSAGYSIVEVLEFFPDGTVKVLAERPVSRLQQELLTDTNHICIRMI